MRGELVPVGQTGSVRRVAVDERLGIYRSEQQIVVESHETTVDLGIRDLSVSRKQNGTVPIELAPGESGIQIRNNRNKNGLTIDAESPSPTTLGIGEQVTVEQDSTVAIGYGTKLRLVVERDTRSRTLSPAELEELGLTGSGGLQYEGVSPMMYVQSVADNLRKATRESPNECLKYATDLSRFLAEHPVDEAGCDEVHEELEQIVEQLEAKVSTEALQGSGLDEEWQQRIDRMAHRVQRLYNG